jgi:hypothetical protein
MFLANLTFDNWTLSASKLTRGAVIRQIKTIGISPGADDAKGEIRAAVAYLLKAAARGDIVREIIEIVTEVARGLPPGGQGP